MSAAMKPRTDATRLNPVWRHVCVSHMHVHVYNYTYIYRTRIALAGYQH
jgi:hypothetical protein